MLGIYAKIININDKQILQEVIECCENRIMELECSEKDEKLKKYATTIPKKFMTAMKINIDNDIKISKYEYKRDPDDCYRISCQCDLVFGPFDINYTYEYKKGYYDTMKIEVNGYTISDHYYNDGIDEEIFKNMCDKLKENTKYKNVNNNTIEDLLKIILDEIDSWDKK